jgi:hypothetical protein
MFNVSVNKVEWLECTLSNPLLPAYYRFSLFCTQLANHCRDRLLKESFSERRKWLAAQPAFSLTSIEEHCPPLAEMYFVSVMMKINLTINNKITRIRFLLKFLKAMLAEQFMN